MPECEHRFVEGPFWITASVTYEEPTYYPPSGLVKVEHCTGCGMLRLPEAERKKEGKHLRDGDL